VKRLLLVGLAALALLACPIKAPLSASPPAKPLIVFTLHHSALMVAAPDTLVGAWTCTGAAPTIACAVNASATNGTLVWNNDAAKNQQSIAVGAPGEIRIVCAAPATTIQFSGFLVGTAPGYANSPPTPTVTQALTCPTKTASTPGLFVITFSPHSGG
jgi:hypothetical protein